MTTVYVLHRFEFGDQDHTAIPEVISIHKTFNGSYWKLRSVSDNLINPYSYNQPQLREIKTEEEVFPGIFVTGFVWDYKYKNKSILDEYRWGFDIFIRDTHENTYTRFIDTPCWFEIIVKVVEE